MLGGLTSPPKLRGVVGREKRSDMGVEGRVWNGLLDVDRSGVLGLYCSGFEVGGVMGLRDRVLRRRDDRAAKGLYRCESVLKLLDILMDCLAGLLRLV